MNIVVIKKDDFNVTQFNDVKNIAFTATIFTITKADDSTVSYTKADYKLSILW